jgi:hypothetical protein
MIRLDGKMACRRRKGNAMRVIHRSVARLGPCGPRRTFLCRVGISKSRPAVFRIFDGGRDSEIAIS